MPIELGVEQILHNIDYWRSAPVWTPETIEEAEAKVDIQGLYMVFNLPQINQVYIFFRADVIDAAILADLRRFHCDRLRGQSAGPTFDPVPRSA